MSGTWWGAPALCTHLCALARARVLSALRSPFHLALFLPPSFLPSFLPCHFSLVPQGFSQCRPDQGPSSPASRATSPRRAPPPWRRACFLAGGLPLRADTAPQSALLMRRGQPALIVNAELDSFVCGIGRPWGGMWNGVAPRSGGGFPALKKKNPAPNTRQGSSPWVGLFFPPRPVDLRSFFF